LHRRRDAGQVMFHLLVPASHPHGGWTDAQAEAEAQAKLDEMLDTLAAAGIGATGDIGDANPVFATGDLIRRGETFDEIIISTLPAGVSRWLASNVVRRLRSYSDLPATRAGSTTSGPTVRCGSASIAGSFPPTPTSPKARSGRSCSKPLRRSTADCAATRSRPRPTVGTCRWWSSGDGRPERRSFLPVDAVVTRRLAAGAHGREGRVDEDDAVPRGHDV